MARGDVDSGMAAATHVFSGEFELGGQEDFYLETHCSLASVDESGQVFVQSSTQHPSETQEIVAHVLDLHSHEVTVQCLRMGGAFGGKEMQPHGLAAVAALGATLTGRPVRLRLNRTQDLTMAGKRHPFHATWQIGFDDELRTRALRATLTSDGGWSLDLSEPVLARALCHIDNAYWIPDIEVQGRIARTNKTSQTAFRGSGGPQGMLVLEDILGRVAPRLGVPAHELRRRNFYTEGQATPYGQRVRHAERMGRIWDRLSETSGLAQRDEEARAFNSAHPHTKRGIAITPVKFGISFNLTAFNQAGALVHVYKDGSVLINHGGTEMGQGLHTKMLQVAATALGIPLAAVRPPLDVGEAEGGADLDPVLLHRQGAQLGQVVDRHAQRCASVAQGELDALVGAAGDQHGVRVLGQQLERLRQVGRAPERAVLAVDARDPRGRGRLLLPGRDLVAVFGHTQGVCRVLDRPVAGAAAQVAGEGVQVEAVGTALVVVRGGTGCRVRLGRGAPGTVELRGHRADEAGRAVAALRAAALGHLLLHRVQALWRAQALGRDDLLAVQRGGGHEAGVDGGPPAALAVGATDEDRAGTALPLRAALLGAGEAMAAQPVQGGEVCLGLLAGVAAAVDGDLDTCRSVNCSGGLGRCRRHRRLLTTLTTRPLCRVPWLPDHPSGAVLVIHANRSVPDGGSTFSCQDLTDRSL